MKKVWLFKSTEKRIGLSGVLGEINKSNESNNRNIDQFIRQ